MILQLESDRATRPGGNVEPRHLEVDRTLISFVGWVSIGLAAGAVARLLRHGPDAMGSMRANLLGVTGSLLGGGFSFESSVALWGKRD